MPVCGPYLMMLHVEVIITELECCLVGGGNGKAGLFYVSKINAQYSFAKIFTKGSKNFQ